MMMIVMLQMLVKCADIGHLAAAPRTHKRWATQLEEEFFRQVGGCTQPCCAMPCYAVLRYACHAMLCCAALCMPCHAMLFYALHCCSSLCDSNLRAVLCVLCCAVSAEVGSGMY